MERGQVLDAYRFPRPDGGAGGSQAGAGAAGLRRADRCAGPHVLNRSYTTGHKAYRARVVEIGYAIGWENAHDAIYAGALDIAVGPRWHSVYEMACNIVTIFIEGKEVHAVPQGGMTEASARCCQYAAPLTDAEETGADPRVGGSARAASTSKRSARC